MRRFTTVPALLVLVATGFLLRVPAASTVQERLQFAVGQMNGWQYSAGPRQ